MPGNLIHKENKAYLTLAGIKNITLHIKNPAYKYDNLIIPFTE